MATSGVVEWVLTARDLVTQALRQNAIISGGEEPTADEMDDCIVLLNGLLKSLPDALFRQADGTFSITAGNSTVVMPETVRHVISARVVDNNYERQLGRWERDDYFILPTKQSAGSPTIFYASENLDDNTVYIWPVPTVDTDLKIDYLMEPETVTDPSETVDFPQRYNEMLFANLALSCSSIFGETPGPELIARASRLRTEFLDEQRPASYYMGPDYA